MKKLLFVLLLTSMCLVGCRTFPPVKNIEYQTLAVHDQQKIEKAIISGATSKGWRVEKVKEGLIHAVLSQRAHLIEVEIPYGEDFYAIWYKHSENLRYNEKKGTIHPRYNAWIIYLSRAINAELYRS